MKKNTLTLALSLAITSLVSAQDLFVSPSSYVYVQDEVIFVNDDIQLDAADSNIYLRDGSQLLQNVDVKNSDIGELSVYQEQSANGVSTGIHEYNYWCSPVGVANTGSNANRPFDYTSIHDPASAAINETTSPQYGTTTAYDATATQLATFWLYQAQNQNDYYDWVAVQQNTLAVTAGNGFTMKGSPNANNVLDFRGRPNTGTINVPIGWDGVEVADPAAGVLPSQVQTLTGNPYPSTLDLKLFLINATNQIALDGAVYFWEQKAVGSHYLQSYEGGFAVYTPGNIADLNDNGSYAVATFGNYTGDGDEIGATSGSSPDYSANNSRRYAAIGQGFCIRNPNGIPGAVTGGIAVIDNSMRLWLKEDSTTGGNGSIFGKTSQEGPSSLQANPTVKAESHNGLDYQSIINNPTIIPEIRIHTKINDTYYRETLLAFRNNTDLSYAKYTDGISPKVLSSDTYFIADDNNLVIKSMEYDIDNRLPFGITAGNESNNTFSVRVFKMKDVPSDINIYIHDKQEGTYTDIKDGTFEVTLDQGTYNDRFEVVFKDAAREIEDEIVNEENEVINSFNIFQNNTNALLTINNPQAHNVKSLIMFDAAGKLIFNEVNLGDNTQHTFPTTNLSTGVYVVKVITNNNIEITKKVSINN